MKNIPPLYTKFFLVLLQLPPVLSHVPNGGLDGEGLGVT